MASSIQDEHWPGENKETEPRFPYPIHGQGQVIPETSSSQEATPKMHGINTTNDDGHKHAGWVDENGNGETDGVVGHSHKIVAGVVQSTHGHVHRLIRPDVFKRGQRNIATNQYDDEGAGFDHNEVY